MMAENEISHVRNIPGSPDQPGISTDHLGDLQPKADGSWEPIPDDPCQRVKPAGQGRPGEASGRRFYPNRCDLSLGLL